MNKDTCILLFGRTGTAEVQYKKFSDSRRSATVISTMLYKHSIKMVKSTGYDVVIFNETSQQGANFAARLNHAISITFAKGYDKLIVVGTDTPQLNAHDIKKAGSLLDQNKMVFGPSKDGGIYLLGINKGQYDNSIIDSISWGTANVLDDLSTYFNCGFGLLRTLVDIDCAYTWRKVVSYTSSFLSQLKSILWAHSCTIYHVYHQHRHTYLALSERGPPVRI